MGMTNSYGCDESCVEIHVCVEIHIILACILKSITAFFSSKNQYGVKPNYGIVSVDIQQKLK